MRVVDHLRQQQNAPPRVLLHRSIGYLDCILHPETEPEVTGDSETNTPEIEDGGGEVATPRIAHLARILDGGHDRRAIEDRDVECTRHENSVRN